MSRCIFPSVHKKREINEILAMAHTTYAVSSAFVGAGADVEGEKKTEGEIRVGRYCVDSLLG